MTEKLLFTKKEIFRFEYFRKYPSFFVNLTMVAVSRFVIRLNLCASCCLKPTESFSRVGFLVARSNYKGIVSSEQ